MGSFRDRFFTPRVARAILSPLTILVAGGAAAATILAGGGLLAIPAAAVAWGARVLTAMPKNKRGPDIDPFVLSMPWRSYVQGAQAAKLRFDRTVKGTAPGPIQDRLRELSTRLDAGIADCWRVAKRGDDIDAALKNLNTVEAKRELDQLRRRLTGRQPSPSEGSTMQALQAQLDSAGRMQAVSKDADDRLRLLDARLDELVAKAVEVSVGAADSGWLSDEVDGVVGDLEALRLALEDTNAAARGATAPLPPADPAPRAQTFPPPS